MLVGELLMGCHGKSLGLYLFEEKPTVLSDRFSTLEAWTLSLTIPLVVTYFKETERFSRRFLVVTGLFVGLLSPFIFQLVSRNGSIMIFAVHIFSLGIGLLVALLNREIRRDMQIEFIKFVFDKTVKLISFLIVLYGAGITALRYVSKLNEEAPYQFISTFFYPTMVFAASLVMIGYWILLPCWEKIIEEYQLES